MFKKVLVANRGEIALRIMRALKEMRIRTVAVHSEADRESLHVKMADESVCIGPFESRESYLSIPRILSAAEITNADAVHPGYGFLAENAEFCNVCNKCGLSFIGPSAETIELMGNKINASAAMKKVGIQILPSQKVDLQNKDGTVKAVREIGLPLIVKAAAGGGGKGIKIVRSEEELWPRLKAAGSEALAAFGNATVYMEKFLENARHIEFQIAADDHGNVVHFGERDCSIQRRYQKVLEEAPSPAVSNEVRTRMGSIVTEAIQKIGYRNLGTVEFLMDSQNNFYFLEMNTRIQVEHPITEEIADIDLVKLQIQLAAGEPLKIQQSDIRLEGNQNR